MTLCVIDSSAALAWILPGEAGPAAQALLERIIQDGALAPPLWRIEVANVLAMAERRSRISAPDRQNALQQLARLPIAFDEDGNARLWGAVPNLALRHELSVYDAIYLELALRSGLPLATLDKALRQAAASSNVPLMLP
ncbi:type II toxin-antitoxin system VapC family toxin [Nitrospirillum sp. BR 11164]|uniref:type II toxin-antitoxin system VapC family toxin n=1 Tax=Nitrospirillum sp. BR 11164 TaxID=3104324 RepID=UPI002AFEAEAC|nr:type II toxin-antitoxin system VapC family toxin [Nitrospirillum sp. BR 11164]MEA1648963.1 type II toxin-antitoxin system VapC family toxin [Nitrospirillum sp. BR 11164]